MRHLTGGNEALHRQILHRPEAVLRFLNKTDWPARIDRWLTARPGPTNPIPARAVLFGICLLTQKRQPFQFETLLQVIMELRVRTAKELGLPLSKVSESEYRPGDPRFFVDINYYQLRRKFHAIVEALEDLDDGADHSFDAFVGDMLWASIPDSAKETMTLIADGTFIRVFAKAESRDKILANPDADWDYQMRSKDNDDSDGQPPSNGKKRTTKPKPGVGYTMLSLMLHDPLQPDHRNYLVGFRFGSGAESEGQLTADAIEQVARYLPVLDMLVVDGGIGRHPIVHNTARKYGGQLLWKLSADQQRAISEHVSGCQLMMGRVFAPNIDLAALTHDPSGKPRYPLSPPLRKHFPDRRSYERAVNEFHEAFERLDEAARKLHTQTRIDGTFRVDVEPTSSDRLHGAAEPVTSARGKPIATTTVRPEDFRVPSHQPFAYGTRLWHYLYAGGRSPNEGSIAHVRNHGKLEGGTGKVRVRGKQAFTLLAACIGATLNLALTGALLPASGRYQERHSKRILALSKNERRRMVRELHRRRKARIPKLRRHRAGVQPIGPDEPITRERHPR